jgi:hypothetical protein
MAIELYWGSGSVPAWRVMLAQALLVGWCAGESEPARYTLSHTYESTVLKELVRSAEER